MAGKVVRSGVTLVALVAVIFVANASASPASPGADTPCSGQQYTQPFIPWLDYGRYVLMPGGALESTGGWSLSGGARIVSGNEPWHVNSPNDSKSLSLPSGSSATSPPLCITLLHPTMRFFATNSGSPLTTLKVSAITNVLGVQLTTPIGLLIGGTWQPTVPLAFLTNLTAPATGTVSFRFAPIGAGSGWRIDDVYVDPFKER